MREAARHTPIWVPQCDRQDPRKKTPQLEALECEADELFYGGQAGGGKTDLIIGASVTEHLHSIIFRREAKQLVGIVQRMTEVIGNRDGYNGSTGVWTPTIPGDPVERIIEFGSTPNAGDEVRYQGRPHDLIAFDEICNFLESQYRFLKGWLRTTAGVRTRVICAGNPPTSPEGQWVRSYWGPWLDPNSYVKAKPGELLYFTTDPHTRKDRLCENGPEPVEIEGELVRPKSRTFIPSSIDDNVFLLRSGYKDQLSALPEPLRSQMRHGDFSAGMEDHAYQVMPSAAVKAAQDRWEERNPKPPMTHLGVDPARGGVDNFVLAPRHGDWLDHLIVVPGSATPDGPAGAALVVQHMRDGAQVMIDNIGIGSSVYDHLKNNTGSVTPVNGAAKTEMRDKTGMFTFFNLRTFVYWKLRERLLDDRNPCALPPDSELLAELCAARYEVRPGNVLFVIPKEDPRDGHTLSMKKILGRSPDRADAVVYAFSDLGAGNTTQNGKRLDWGQAIQYPEAWDRAYV